MLLGLQFSLDQVPVVPLVTGLRPRYGQEEEEALCSQAGWPAAAVPYRKEQQQLPRLHSQFWGSISGGGGGVSSSVVCTGDQERKEETSVGQQGKAGASTQDSGYSTSGNPTSTTSTSTNLPVTAGRMKPSFMMNIAGKDKKNQSKPSHPQTKLTRKMKPDHEPFHFFSSLSKLRAETEAQGKLSQRFARELNVKKEKKSNKSDEDIMAF